MSLRDLLEHHVDRAAAGAKFNAIANCHTEHLDSIVLHDEPGNRVRMFVARPGHGLWRNDERNAESARAPFSIGIHAHHCDLRLVGLFGNVENHEYALAPHPKGDFIEFAYTSGVNAIAAMDPTGQRAFAHCYLREPLLQREAVFMHSHRMHTVYLPGHELGAWLVIEGREDPDFKPRCWSNVPNHDFDGLYLPMDGEAVANTLRWVVSRLPPQAT